MGVTKVYFNKVSKLISARGAIAGGTGHGSTTGTNREIIVKEFLEKHIPKRLSTSTGGVILGRGNPSNQIDVIINSDSALQFKECDQLYTCVDSMAAAISVKSKLTKSKLFQALNEFNSIPRGFTGAIKVNSYITGEEERTFLNNFFKRTPILCIMAYDGISAETIMNHLKDYYSVNHHVHENRRPTYIWVNDTYLILRLEYDKAYQPLIANGEMTQFFGSSDVYRIIDIKNNEGFPYICLLTSLNTFINRENNISYDLRQYFIQS